MQIKTDDVFRLKCYFTRLLSVLVVYKIAVLVKVLPNTHF